MAAKPLRAITREDLLFYRVAERDASGAVASWRTLLGQKASRRGVIFALESFNLWSGTETAVPPGAEKVPLPSDEVLCAYFFDASLREARPAAEGALPPARHATFILDDDGTPYVAYLGGFDDAATCCAFYRRPRGAFLPNGGRAGDLDLDRKFYTDRALLVAPGAAYDADEGALLGRLSEALLRARRHRGLRQEIADRGGKVPRTRPPPPKLRTSAAPPPAACVSFLENKRAERLAEAQARAKSGIDAFRTSRNAEGRTMHAYECKGAS